MMNMTKSMKIHENVVSSESLKPSYRDKSLDMRLVVIFMSAWPYNVLT